MISPHYQHVAASQIPTEKNDGVIVKIIAEESMGKLAKIKTKTPISYLHFTMQPGSSITQNIPQEYNAFAYIVSGEGLFGDEEKSATEKQMVLFEQNGSQIKIKVPDSKTSPLEMLLIAGIPLNEPIARSGPFVMNSEEEIQQAIQDYNSGKLGSIDF